jgi:hypothetical protein
MKEEILEITPDVLRNVVELVGDSVDSLDREELLKVADELEKNGSYSVIRPAYKVTWVNTDKK